MTQMFLYTVIPTSAAVIGAVLAAWRPPSATATSAIQHFAAGVVFAAAVGEILPDLKHATSPWPIVIGGGAGVALMLGLKSIEARAGGTLGLLLLVAIDILIDGLVVGIGFTAGQKAGVLLTIALTLEVLFLGLTVATEIGGTSASRAVIATACLALLLPIGAMLAAPISTLPAVYVTGFFAFGLIALLYLVTEELLVEAHATPDTPWVTALFFAGFLLLLVLEEAIR